MTKEQEIEIKFYLADLPSLQRRVESLGAQLKQPRTFEANLRFDSAGRGLSSTFQVLRLRKDTASRLTYKGPDQPGSEVHIRREIEFEVSDFDAARSLLEALGYHVMMAYEKYRTVYELDGQEITLDEMPFGTFTEIEGTDPDSIHRTADALGLDWTKRIAAGYVVLFSTLKEKLRLTIQDLTFDNFKDWQPTPADLGVAPADAANSA